MKGNLEKLANGIYRRRDDDRIQVFASVHGRPGRRERILPAGTSLSVAASCRESLVKDLQNSIGKHDGLKIKAPASDPSNSLPDIDISSLTRIEKFEQALMLYRVKPREKSGEIRKMHGQRGAYRRLLKYIGQLPPNEVEHGLEEMIEDMEEQGLAPKTINCHISMAQSAEHIAYRTKINVGKERIRLLPVRYIDDYPKKAEDNIAYRILNAEERLRLWNKLSFVMKGDDCLQALYYFALLTPVRISELINLTRENLNQISGALWISKTKNGFSRTIALSDLFRQRLNNLPQNATHLFCDRNGKHLGKWSNERQKLQFAYYEEFMEACKLSEIEGYNFHKTRQEAVMVMYANGSDIQDIMMVGGWKSEDAFYRYFNRELALQIKQKTYDLDMKWIDTFKDKLGKVA